MIESGKTSLESSFFFNLISLQFYFLGKISENFSENNDPVNNSNIEYLENF